MGCQTIFLEKPGAPTVAELEKMRNDATEAGTSVFMGFNKNVSAYLSRTREFAAKADQKCDVTFLHNNAYENTEKELAECFERNSEGMLKNMAIHELAILVTFYDVRVDTIASVEADKIFSSCKTLKGPSSGKHFTDFDKIKFKIITKAGVEINVAADRCGGDDSVGIVEASGKELSRFTMPDEEDKANVSNLEEEYPGAMPYFYAQVSLFDLRSFIKLITDFNVRSRVFSSIIISHSNPILYVTRPGSRLPYAQATGGQVLRGWYKARGRSDHRYCH